ncbi:hypothetical protein OIU84_016139 [Salix udensis]|uniref:Uncharacterized protein n=1 Tax=Salix udensis TaxID=889485 RepID=A0AAD6JAM3_9ROSI|nr:hypothetical protein OIU84_016139 [Salix udensis]
MSMAKESIPVKSQHEIKNRSTNTFSKTILSRTLAFCSASICRLVRPSFSIPVLFIGTPHETC